jgi:hypothetical protein
MKKVVGVLVVVGVLCLFLGYAMENGLIALPPYSNPGRGLGSPPSADEAAFGFVIIGAAVLFLALVLEIQRRKEIPEAA